MATDFEIMTKHVESGIEEANCFCELVREALAADDGSIPVWQHVRLDNIVDFVKTKRKKLHDVRRAAQKKPDDAARVGHYTLTAEHVAGEIQTFIDEGLEALTSKEVKGNLVKFHQDREEDREAKIALQHPAAISDAPEDLKAFLNTIPEEDKDKLCIRVCQIPVLGWCVVGQRGNTVKIIWRQSVKETPAHCPACDAGLPLTKKKKDLPSAPGPIAAHAFPEKYR